MSDSKPDTKPVVYFDGECPFCQKEIDWLKARAPGEQVRVIDISQSNFQADADGPSKQEMMARFHVQRADGVWLEGMPAFRHLYQQAGLGWLVAPTGWPVLRPLFDAAYRLFARYRVPLGNAWKRLFRRQN